MPETPIQSFTVNRLSVLDIHGHADESLLPDLCDSDLVRMYELLVLTRAFDDRALKLQREGRMGTYPSVLGQEAAQVGSAFALKTSDWIFPSFRELGVFLSMDYPLARIFQYWAGDERGQICPENLNIFPICIAVGTHIPHAAGAALAARLRGDEAVAVAYFGDGATSKGDFHEGLNMAAVYRAPALFICQNNQWAISIPRKSQSVSRTLAQKALAYGMPGIQVDGNDVLAVYRATLLARQRALRGEGPTFIECETYRMSDHTTADDARRYRDPAEVEPWKARDPISRMRLFLEARKLWSDQQQQVLEAEHARRIDEAVREFESIEPAAPSEMFTHTWHELTPRQREELKELKNAGS